MARARRRRLAARRLFGARKESIDNLESKLVSHRSTLFRWNVTRRVTCTPPRDDLHLAEWPGDCCVEIVAFRLHGKADLTPTEGGGMQLMEETRPVVFCEQGLHVRTLVTKEDLSASYRLRHQVFAERLQWVDKSDDGIEVDSYDVFATSVGLFDHAETLRGVFRMVTPPALFMLESEFKRCLLPDCEVRRERDTAEITRLAIDPAV